MSQSDTKENPKEEPTTFSSISFFGLYAEKRGRGEIKGEEILLSVYKSEEDATFITNLLLSKGKHSFPHFHLSDKDELFVRKIPAFVSFGETLPSDEETISQLEEQLDKILQSLDSDS